jgi:hypothetical protein
MSLHREEPVGGQISKKPVRSPLPGFWHHSPKRLNGPGEGVLLLLSRGAPWVALTSLGFAILALHESGLGQFALGVVMFLTLIAVPVAALLVGVFARRIAHAPRLRKRDLALIDDPSRDLLVEVVVSSGYSVLAKDRGALGFADGTLFFSGHSFSFLIGSQDVAERLSADVDLGSPFETALDLKHENGRVHVHFFILEGGLWNDRMWQLSDAIHALRHSEPTQEERRYPPLGPWRAGEGS